MSQQTALDREVPVDETSEIGLVGSLLRDHSKLDDVRVFVSPLHLFSPEPAAVFAAMCSLADASKPINLLTIIAELERRESLPGKSAREVVVEIAAAVPTTAHADYFAAKVREKSVFRSVISFTGEIQRRAFDSSEPASDIIDALQNGAAKIAEEGFVNAGKLAGEVLPDVIDDIEGYKEDPFASAIPTGFPELDHRTGGMKSKQLWCIGGAGKIGKTSFALNIVSHVGLELKHPVAFISHEMTISEIVERLLVSTTGVSRDNLQTQNMTAKQRARYAEVKEAIRDCRIVIDDAAGTTIHATRVRLRLFQRIHKIRLAVVDYFQLMGGTDPRVRRYDQLVEVSRGLKQMANDLNLPILVLAQLNAEGQDATRPPRVTDIEECKRIFKDSNVVILLDREYERRKHDAAWLRSGGADPKAATIDIAAIRAGEAGVINAVYHGNIQRWRTLEQDAQATYQQQELGV